MVGEPAALDNLVTTARGSAADDTLFHLSFDGHVARLTMARARYRNAVRSDDWRALPALVEQAARGGARVILLASAVAGSFSAGVDLNELVALREDAAARLPLRNAMRAGLNALRASPVPVIALVDGDCFGAGVALAIACDIRVAGPAARFAVTPARLGISYQFADITRLRALVGEGQAARLLLAAEAIDTAEALRIGLAELAGGAAQAEKLAAAIAANAPSSVAALKSGLAATGDDAGENHDRAFDAAFGGPDFAVGLAAFRARRTPEFD
ncbi:enoyl-CoA hydratase/isomerase family protein [Sphingomonas flavalba]|uniref:enoyl-CoA hydratase/isomerase family protein n=1 Tax=Sphingomonas flavalba TaxID=2559804 RepID=UPI0039DF3033